MSPDNGTPDEPAPAPPEGYVLSEGRGGFSTLNGPYFYRAGDGTMGNGGAGVAAKTQAFN